MDALVTTRNLSRTFGDRRAVKGVSLSLRPGEVLGFLGPNGAGKSTTLRMLSGALAPTGGELLLEGVPLAEAAGPDEGKARPGYRETEHVRTYYASTRS